MTECTNHRPWDTKMPSHKISHDQYYEKWGTIDKIKHKPSMLQSRIWHTRITTILRIKHIISSAGNKINQQINKHFQQTLHTN